MHAAGASHLITVHYTIINKNVILDCLANSHDT